MREKSAEGPKRGNYIKEGLRAVRRNCRELIDLVFWHPRVQH